MVELDQQAHPVVVGVVELDLLVSIMMQVVVAEMENQVPSQALLLQEVEVEVVQTILQEEQAGQEGAVLVILVLIRGAVELSILAVERVVRSKAEEQAELVGQA